MRTKVTVLALALTVIVAAALSAQEPSAAELLRRIDDNEIYTTIEYEGEMIIEYQNRRYVKTLRAWARGDTDSFIEFTNPEDRGTRYLRKGPRLYVYSPDTEEVMLISGHMLKESMMGSDMSYEDTISNDSLSSRYDPAHASPETREGRDCWVLDLTARQRTESYPRRRLWIDRETGDLLHYELYALSGAKLKEYSLLRVEVIGGRRFPVEVVMRDLLRRGSRTTIIMRNVALDRPIADSVFSTRNLER
ncbi:MAG: outer membrane lipoprotein-sorting protein [Spirochaetaceae bacterium]|jgi:outer membrane lipoprotein-sorting protein|nr:outer membrane lipoprotein-sorting protein [Spirochaetaceae bacterium]